MTFRNVKLILAREIRDQLRDRRTLFVILVLPVLLYPLLGMSFFQVAQFLHKQPSRILVLGSTYLDVPPALIEGDEGRRFAKELFPVSKQADLLEVRRVSDEPRPGNLAAKDPREYARRQVQSEACDAALYFPPDFAPRLRRFRRAIALRARAVEEGVTESETLAALPPEDAIPRPEIIYSSAHENSTIAFNRLQGVVQRWLRLLGEQNLQAGGLSPIAVRPFEFREDDVAEDSGLRNAAVWAKMLPVMLLLWALTGAFYPAIDLCAGEKERGTLETLLSSPAGRGEIVLGKLLTVMLFSVVSAVLNLASIGLTAWIILRQLGGFGPPPPLAWLWLLLALLPISALFSALCLALAAFARSTKEGQYYLMPLLMVTLPLVVLPMSPGVELNFGNSLIPVTGVVLLLRTLLEGNYLAVLPYLPVVLGVTLVACLMAIRWAVDQFNTEAVLFHEGERFSPGVWLRHVFRDRQSTPTAAAALLCGLLILLVQFFLSLIGTVTLEPSASWTQFVKIAVLTQLVVIFTPTLLMTSVASRSPRQTLQLHLPAWKTLFAAAALAVVLHPVAILLQTLVTALYPVSEEVLSGLKKFDLLLAATPFGILVLVMALLPALFEELAFRGFLLSGFRRMGYKWRAIVLSAFFFGITHAFLQQSMITFLVGLAAGYVVVQSGSILPGMIFHFMHNLLVLLSSRITPELCQRQPWLKLFVTSTESQGVTYDWQIWAIGAILGGLILAWFHYQPYPKTPEELLREALRRGSDVPPGEDEVSVRLVQALK
ncbi:MAG: CPBP family intramembrane metalloprotease [Pirellulales bacterium]|nr:CPBP family intramembrane metalloprotease [Pirellulales bacterium]